MKLVRKWLNASQSYFIFHFIFILAYCLFISVRGGGGGGHFRWVLLLENRSDEKKKRVKGFANQLVATPHPVPSKSTEHVLR